MICWMCSLRLMWKMVNKKEEEGSNGSIGSRNLVS